MLQQRVVNRLFGGVLVRRAGQDHAVVINAADIAGFRIAGFIASLVASFNDRQVAVNRVARSHQAESPPQARLRGPFQRRCNIYKESDCNENDREKRRCHRHGPKLLAAHSEQQNCCHTQVQEGDDNRDLEGLKKAHQHNAGQDPSEAGTSGLQQVSRTGSDASGDGALLFVHPGRNHEKRACDNAKQAQTCQGCKQHRHRTNQFARHCLKKSSGGAQCPDRRQQADAEQAFERGDRPASVAPAQCKPAAQATAGGGPEEPGGQHNSQRNLVAVEDDDELPHENDLADDRAESYQRQRRSYGRRWLFGTRHCDGLHRRCH